MLVQSRDSDDPLARTSGPAFHKQAAYMSFLFFFFFLSGEGASRIPLYLETDVVIGVRHVNSRQITTAMLFSLKPPPVDGGDKACGVVCVYCIYLGTRLISGSHCLPRRPTS